MTWPSATVEVEDDLRLAAQEPGGRRAVADEDRQRGLGAAVEEGRDLVAPLDRRRGAGEDRGLVRADHGVGGEQLEQSFEVAAAGGRHEGVHHLPVRERVLRERAARPWTGRARPACGPRRGWCRGRRRWCRTRSRSCRAARRPPVRAATAGRSPPGGRCRPCRRARRRRPGRGEGLGELDLLHRHRASAARSRSRHSRVVTVVSQAGRFSISVSSRVTARSSRSHACWTTSSASAWSASTRVAMPSSRGRSASKISVCSMGSTSPAALFLTSDERRPRCVTGPGTRTRDAHWGHGRPLAPRRRRARRRCPSSLPARERPVLPRSTRSPTSGGLVSQPGGAHDPPRSLPRSRPSRRTRSRWPPSPRPTSRAATSASARSASAPPPTRRTTSRSRRRPRAWAPRRCGSAGCSTCRPVAARSRRSCWHTATSTRPTTSAARG